MDLPNPLCRHTRRFLRLLPLSLLLLAACEGERDHLAQAVNENDSLPFLRSKGISTLISDSGVIRYKLVAEEWDIHTHTQPATWKFNKGLLMERFDEDFHIDLYVQADTAYLHQQRTWELRGRVVIRNAEGTLFHTEELFWDMDEHQMWNTTFMRITTPERELQGTHFRSNEQMTDYYVANSSGAVPMSDTSGPAQPQDSGAPRDTAAAVESTTPTGQRAGRIMPTAPGKQNQQGHFK